MVERTKNSSNLIGGEQKSVCLAFALKVDGLQIAYMVALFGSFGTKNLFSGEKLIRNIYENPNSRQTDKLFFPKLYKVFNLYILMDFYLVLSRRLCPRSSRPTPIVNRPLPSTENLYIHHSNDVLKSVLETWEV